MFTKAPNSSTHVTRFLTTRGIVILTIYILIEFLEKSLQLVGRDKLILLTLVPLKKLSSDLAKTFFFLFLFFIKEVFLCNGTNLHRFGEKILFCMKFCYFSHDLFVAFFSFSFFFFAAYFYQSITNRYKLKIDWDNTHRPHLFSWTYIFLECRDTSSNVHSTEIKTIGDKNDCIPHAFLPGLCAKQFPGFLSVTPDDTLMKLK